MNQNTITLLITTLLASGLPAAVVDFDSLPAGAILTNQLVASHNLLVTPSGSALSGRVTNAAINEFTTANFGNSDPMAVFVANPGDSLRLDFVEADGVTPMIMTNVSLRAGDGDSADDTFRVTFYDFSLAPLSIQNFVTQGGPVNGGVTVSCPGCSVRRILVEAFPSATAPGSGMLIDDVSGAAVPEPGTVGLLTAGLTGVLLMRRRSARS